MRLASRRARSLRTRRLAHACTSWTSPALRSRRCRPVTSRKTSSSEGSAVEALTRAQVSLQIRRAFPAVTIFPSSMIARRSQSCVGLFEVLRGEEHRGSLLVDASDLVPDDHATGWVEPGGRLVEEQARRGGEPARTPGRDVVSCRLSSPWSGDRPLRPGRRARAVLRLVGRPRRGTARTAGPAAPRSRDRSGEGRGRPLAARRRSCGGPRQGRLTDIDARHRRRATGDAGERRQHPHGGGLAGPVGAKEAEDLAMRGRRGRHLAPLRRCQSGREGLDQARVAGRRLRRSRVKGDRKGQGQGNRRRHS